jgi:D-alanine transaminase
VAAITAEDNRWLHCDLKTTSLLGNVLMRNLAADRGAIEVVMFRDGMLTEASASNVVAVRNGIIVAPPKNNLILPGITYGAVYDLAVEGGLPFEMRPVTREETLSADELWLTSSTKEVLAITTLDGRPFRGGRPGPMFRRMRELFQRSKARA